MKLCGWGPYKGEETVDFTVFEDRGIFLVTGATGAGKTSVFDAITYALYGSLSGEERDKERGSVRSDFAEPATPTYVELVMEHGGKTYRIRRNPEYMRPKKRGSRGEALTREKENAILYYPDDRVLEGVKEVNAALKEILVLDHQQFKKISMIAQGEFAKLLVAPPKDKTRIFREIFDTGVYERFTQSLGAKARAAYSRVTEQKHKLEEDVRLLTEGLEGSEWSLEDREALGGLTSGENWNYPAIAALLEQMKGKAEQKVRARETGYTKADVQLQKLAEELARRKEENERIRQFQKAHAEKARLEAEGVQQKSAQERYTRAVSAAEVEKAEGQTRNLEGQLARNLEERRHMEAEREQLLNEAAELKTVTENAEGIRSLLELRKSLEDEEKSYEVIKGHLEKEQARLREKQKAYLDEDADHNGKKAAYEEAERKKRLNVIGLAAAQLREGEPCPVCGSLHHPAPAEAAGEDISEGTLAKLKKAMEESFEGLMRLHEQSIALKTQVESLEEQALQSQKKLQEAKAQAESFQGEVYTAFRVLPPREGLEKLQEKCHRASRLSGLIQEKDSALVRYGERDKALHKDWEAARELFEAELARHGFRCPEDYAAAALTADQREELRDRMEDYRLRVAKNQELYSHLEGTISAKVPADLTEQTEMLDNLRKERDNIRKGQELWKRQLSEVEKTLSLMEGKLAVMERESREYGYIKDLENMASGNNAQRLVFEQYVLAGYFEEILRAANLRFAKMSGGRYEMSRVAQVGDGRVKDSLEIQVMDYYTGKNRSVRTLSGGESFKASLALALGMSDVIQAMNGGIRVDTLFVDEGFGALDSESLDQACDTLMGLVGKKQLIGIISHVPELRERIQSQLVINKTGSGSTIRNGDWDEI